MSSIKQNAQEYEVKKTKNIAELELVSTDIELEQRDFIDSNGKPFTVDVIVVDGEDYRVPVSVIAQLHQHLEANPRLQSFKVRKAGEGLKTSYTVIPMN